VARRLGHPFMPWQQYVADVALEIDPETGRLAYDEIDLTVPRQSGKSTWVEAKAVHRCSASKFFGPRQRVVYTAQTRQKAREKWEQDFVPDLEAARAFRGRFHPSWANGNEHLRFSNGSRWGLEASTEKAGHGGTIDESYIDEAFAQPDFRLEQAFGPAMITRLNKQLVVISTAGWLGASPYLESKVKAGRAAVAEGRRSGRAYFEWSAPQDADPGDEAVWRACMPALGRTITVEAIRAEYEKARDQGKLNEFRRAYLNQWVLKDVPDKWAVIPDAAWRLLADEGSEPVPPAAFACVFSSDRSHAAIGVAGARADGLLHVEVAEYRKGTSWAAPWLIDRHRRHHPCAVVVDAAGHEGSVIPELEQAGIEVVSPQARDVAQAYGQFYDAATDSQILRHRDQENLNTALAGATTREIGDAGKAWGRKASGADIAPLVAVTEALWGFLKYGPAGDYDAGQSVHFDTAELIRLCRAGIYGPMDIHRVWSRGLLNEAALAQIAEAGVPVPPGLAGGA
jgi:phage terminase large subunit-like protein